MDISTPWYTTTKEQYHISHMSIRTPCKHYNERARLCW
jgi:hypothetical protein